MAKLTDKNLADALNQAIAGDRDALDELCEDNLWRDDGDAELDELDRVARRIAACGADADDVIEAMAALDEVDCEEDTAEEILPIVGLLAFGHRLAADFARLEPFVDALERTAQDQRARVRAVAPLALAHAGAAHGPRLLERFGAYLKTGGIDSFVLDALAMDEWLLRFDDPQPLVDKLDQVLRACAKSPSWDTVATYKRQTESLRRVPAAIAARFPDAIDKLFASWATMCTTGPIALSKDGGKDVKPFWQKGLERVAAILAVDGVKVTVKPSEHQPAPAKKRDDSATATGGDVDGLLPRLDAWLRKNRPDYYAGLKPPATVDSLAALEQQLGAPLPDDARALWAWKNGETLGAGGRFYENWSLMSARDATATMKELGELLDAGDLEGPLPWSKRWLPILENGGGDHLVIDLERDGQIVRFYHDDDNRVALFPSLRTLLHVLVGGVEAGAFAVEDSGLFAGDAKRLAKLLTKHAAGYPRPITR